MQKNILEYLTASANKYPNKVAYYDEQVSATYSDVVRYSKSIASFILDKKKISNRPIAVFMDKGVCSLIAFHGITFSGNIYVPIDIKQPHSRIESILNVLEPEFVIVTSEDKHKAEELFGHDKIIEYNAALQYTINEKHIDNVLNTQISTDPLYILFTSGSTGIPKGVCITHQAVIDFIDWLSLEFNITENDRFANQAPFHFDNSILDIYSTLKHSATLYIIPEKDFRYPNKLLDMLSNHKITIIFWVPSVLVNIANADLLSDFTYDGLKYIFFAGEVMPNKQLNIWRHYKTTPVYANLYGLTEIADICTYYIVDREFLDDEPLPIGKACLNTDIILLKEDDSLAKHGERGEICVRGISLATGYYNDKERTAAVFTQNPLNPHYPELIYRTGDIGYYNQYGELMFAGRKDFQIKHKGYRLELGEIENAASSLENIEHCCAVYNYEKEEIHLFYSGAENIDSVKIKKSLLEYLPRYAIPNHIHYIELMPLISNGKIDRNKLKELLNTL